jgi:protein involved in polysaccharide export with SLBB domain
LLGELKNLLAQRMQAQGSAIDAQSITNEMLYAQLQSDPQFREEAARWMADHGDISQDTAKAIIAARQPPPERGQGTGASQAASGASASVSAPSVSAPPTATAPLPAGTSANVTPPPPALSPDQRVANEAAAKGNPYPGLPSAADLYKQNPSQPAALARFGSDIFRPDMTGMKEFSMDIPAGPDYVLGPGDTLAIDIWGGVSQQITRPVDREGRISLPDAGPVTVAGMTLANAERRIQEMLRPQYRDARVAVSVTRLRTVRVYVVGDVQRPGAYDISSLSTPLNALYVAGGPTVAGSMRVIKHYRGSQLVSEQDLYDLLLKGVRKVIEHLEPGDTILVPPVGPLVAVAGAVRRPAIYELKDKTDQLSDVIDMSGGVTVSALVGEVKVERVEAHDQRVTLKVPLQRKGAGATAEVAAFQVQDGDRVFVSAIDPFKNQTVYLEGHVYRPGSYPFTVGMSISDLVRSYRDVLPEPATHGEIVRLLPPDYRPIAISFDLPTVLAGGEPLPLQQFDTVRIFGRYEIDAPKVTIVGQVLRPGDYPMSAGMTAAALVKMAGGFNRSAYTDTASLSSYTIQNGTRVVTEQQTVRNGTAVAGSGDQDAVLKPGDVLTILQIPGWSEIGRSVTIRGEVAYPGTYGINEGEKLSGFLKRVGGFTSAAFPAGIVLERVEVRRLEEQGRAELIRRLQGSSANIQVSPNTTGPEQTALLQTIQQQTQDAIAQLRSQPANGRLVLTVSSAVSEWENTPHDVLLREGDVITVPKKPNFVLSYGQVYNPNAITYSPGKPAKWYLRQAGGPTQLANKKGIYIIRANGSVISSEGGNSWLTGGVLETKMQPGDVLVVPEKLVTGTSAWKTTLETAQFISSLAIAAAVIAQL